MTYSIKLVLFYTDKSCSFDGSISLCTTKTKQSLYSPPRSKTRFFDSGWPFCAGA